MTPCCRQSWHHHPDSMGKWTDTTGSSLMEKRLWKLELTSWKLRIMITQVKSLVLALHLKFLIKMVLCITAWMDTRTRASTQTSSPSLPSYPRTLFSRQIGMVCHLTTHIHSKGPGRMGTKALTGLDSGKESLQSPFLCYAYHYTLILFHKCMCWFFDKKKTPHLFQFDIF